jgi:hypothetical protein
MPPLAPTLFISSLVRQSPYLLAVRAASYTVGLLAGRVRLRRGSFRLGGTD